MSRTVSSPVGAAVGAIAVKGGAGRERETKETSFAARGAAAQAYKCDWKEGGALFRRDWAISRRYNAIYRRCGSIGVFIYNT
jgi:hypothetical protein